jgi:hypothetical protein
MATETVRGSQRPDYVAGAGGFEPLHLGIRSAGAGHRLRLSLLMRCSTPRTSHGGYMDIYTALVLVVLTFGIGFVLNCLID